MWLLATLLYAVNPIYFDHLEPTVVVTAQQWLHGRPLYHSLDAPYLYSTLFGPFDYLWLALTFQLCPDPVLASKLSGGFWSLGSLVMLLLVFRRMGGIWVAIACVGVVGGELMTEWLVPFWDRPDPILTFSVSLGLGALTVRNRRFGTAILIIAIALAIDSKIHGFLYLLPIAAVWWQRHGFQAFLLVLFFAAALALSPFLLPNISLTNYVLWLRMGSHHPLEKELFRESLETFLMQLFPLVLFAAHRRLQLGWSKSSEETILFLAFLLAGALVCIPASKAGSGPHHLVPFTVYVGYFFCAGLVDSVRRLRLTWAAGVFMVWGLFTYTKAASACLHLWELRQLPDRFVQTDLRQILMKYPATEMEMGAGDDSGYGVTFYSPWLYREGAPCVLDIGAYMDMKESGLGSGALSTSMAKEQFRYWLIPRDNRPFSMYSPYDEKPLFDESVGQLFLKHYGKIDTTPYFDVYQAKAVSQ